MKTKGSAITTVSAILGLAYCGGASAEEGISIDKAALSGLPDLGGGAVPRLTGYKSEFSSLASGTEGLPGLSPSMKSVGGVIVEVCNPGEVSPDMQGACSSLAGATADEAKQA